MRDTEGKRMRSFMVKISGRVDQAVDDQAMLLGIDVRHAGMVALIDAGRWA